MSTYIIADLNLFIDAQRKKMGYVSFDQMNNDIIKRWNKLIKEDDEVIIMGCNGGGTFEQMKSVFSRLNGKLTCLSYHLNNKFTKEQWREIGFKHFWTVSMYNELPDGREIVYLNSYMSEKNRKKFELIVVDSQNPIEGMVGDHVISVDAAKWQYSPLNTAELLTIYNNMQEWESMEDGTETRKDVKEE